MFHFIYLLKASQILTLMRIQQALTNNCVSSFLEKIAVHIKIYFFTSIGGDKVINYQLMY